MLLGRGALWCAESLEGGVRGSERSTVCVLPCHVDFLCREESQQSRQCIAVYFQLQERCDVFSSYFFFLPLLLASSSLSSFLPLLVSSCSSFSFFHSHRLLFLCFFLHLLTVPPCLDSSADTIAKIYHVFLAAISLALFCGFAFYGSKLLLLLRKVEGSATTDVARKVAKLLLSLSVLISLCSLPCLP